MAPDPVFWGVSRARWRPCDAVIVPEDNLEPPNMDCLTPAQAYEAAYRFVWQYSIREPVDPLLLMLVSMEPTDDDARTSDPASWPDWLGCVAATLADDPVPKFPRQ